MNSSSTNNTVKTNLSSFVAAPVSTANNIANAAKNAALNLKNSTTNLAKNMWNSEPVQDVAEPIMNSYNDAVNSENGLLTIPVMIGLGILIICFVLFVIFRDQILLGIEIAWIKVKHFFGSSPPPAAAPAPEFAPSHDTIPPPVVEKNAVEKILPGKKDVFNIATNKYTYNDAEPLCKAFGAELATYDQVKDAWNKGADWCNYGWIKGQAAVYPTQEATYEKLQGGPEDQRGACGVPGINGGYFDNPNLRFGVNCYGSRPNQSEADVRHKMGADGGTTPDGIAYNRKVQDFKAHRTEIPVNPFNETVWSG